MYGYGTRKNRWSSQDYARRPMQRHPKPANETQVYWIRKLVNEKQVDPARVAMWLTRLDAGSMMNYEAGKVLDELFSAKDKIVLPSMLGPQDEGRPASRKQKYWAEKLAGEKDIPEAEKLAVEAYLVEGLTDRHAGHILDYLFEAPDKDAPHGYVGTVGEKIVVEGKVKKYQAVMTRYGETNLIEVITPEGHSVKMFSNNKSFRGLAEGNGVKVAGTVKSHEPWHGSEQTILKSPHVVEMTSA